MTIKRKDIDSKAIFQKALNTDASFKRGRLLTIIIWTIALLAIIANLVCSIIFTKTDYFEYFGVTHIFTMIVFCACMVSAINGVDKINVIPLIGALIIIVIDIIQDSYSLLSGNYNDLTNVWLRIYLFYPYVIIIMMILPFLFKDCRHFSNIGNQINTGKIVSFGGSSSTDDFQ